MTMNPARVLVQRVLVDVLVVSRSEELADIIAGPAMYEMGMLQTFEVRIALAFTDSADDFDSVVSDAKHGHLSLGNALAAVAAEHYGLAAKHAVDETLVALLNRREETVGERGVW